MFVFSLCWHQCASAFKIYDIYSDAIMWVRTRVCLCKCFFFFYSSFCCCCCCCFPWRKIIKVELCGANLISLFVCAIQFGCSLFSAICINATSAHKTHTQTSTRFEIVAFQKLFILKHFRPCDSRMFITQFTNRNGNLQLFARCVYWAVCSIHNSVLFSADGVRQKKTPKSTKHANKRTNKRKRTQQQTSNEALITFTFISIVICRWNIDCDYLHNENPLHIFKHANKIVEFLRWSVLRVSIYILLFPAYSTSIFFSNDKFTSMTANC